MFEVRVSSLCVSLCSSFIEGSLLSLLGISGERNCTPRNVRFLLCLNCSLLYQLHWKKSVFKTSIAEALPEHCDQGVFNKSVNQLFMKL